MLLIKANPELKNVFKRLIKTMDMPVTWNDIFVVTNNILILSGDVRSLIFNFDNKKIYTSILEIPAESKQLESMPSDTLLNNVMNITLYAFGKWGTISGLKVDKDYQTLNTLFSQILRPVNIEPGFGTNNFRFFKKGMQITYEDTMLDVLRLLRNEGKLNERQSLVTSEVKNKDEKASQRDSALESETEQNLNDDLNMADYENDYEIGLWHNLSWKKDTCTFNKTHKNDADTARSRIGNDFYITNYLCPECEERLYMGVYPVDRELLIDTEEGRVFMARTYACHNCNTFYTPRPKKLLQEGDIYILKFDEDRTAYEDYLDILGRKAKRTTNYKFNEFKAERNSGSEEAPAEEMGAKPGMAADNGAEPAALSGIKSLKERISKGGMKLFTKNKINKDSETQNPTAQNLAAQDSPRTAKEPSKNPEMQTLTQHKAAMQQPKTLNAEPHIRETLIKDDQTANNEEQSLKTRSIDPTGHKPQTAPALTEHSEAQHIQQKALLSQKTTDELKVILSDLERKNENSNANRSENTQDSNYIEAVKETLLEKLTAKYDARIGILNSLAPRQLSDLKNQIEKEAVLSSEQKEGYIKEINKRLYKAEENALEQKIELSKKKSYAEIEQIIDEVEKRDIPDELKQEALRKLQLVKSDRASREAEHLLTHMPLHMDRKQLSAYIGKLDQYKEVDLTPYRTQLEQRMDMAEKEEISAMVKRGGKKDRAALWSLYEQLQERDYKEENKAPFLEKIYDKVRQLDEDAIERICPSIVTLSFADGLQAYEEISQGMFLPELKANTLEMIQRRLTKLKTDESVQLMRKLKNDMTDKMTDCEGFYFYNAREEMKMSSPAQSRKRINDNEEENDSNGDEGSRTAMLRAVNGYAAARGEYEYPIMVCDTSRSKNGKEGFVLTPDNIFYHTFLNSGVINILDIDKVQIIKRIFSKGIFVKRWSGKKEKLPNNVKPEDLEAFTKILDDFATYLQEKPESRNIEYMAKEKHDVIHCYRCGFVYKNGNVCPKCGSKMNR